MKIFFFLLAFPVCAQKTLQQAQQKFDAGEFAQAGQLLTKAIEKEGRQKNAFLLRGKTRLAQENFYEAIGDLNTALEIDSALSEAHCLLAKGKLSLGDNEGCIKEAAHAIRQNAKNGLAYTYRGIARSNLEAFQEAHDDFSMAIKLGENNADNFFNRGAVKAELEEHIGAIDDFSKSIELDSADAEVFYYRGMSYALTQNFPKAIADYSRAIAKNKEAAYFENRALSYLQSENYKSALHDLNEALKLQREPDAETWALRADVKKKLGDWKGCEADLTEAIDCRETDDYFFERAQCRMELRDFAGAANDYSTLLQQEGLGEIYYLRALANLNINKTEACVDLKKALTLGYGEAQKEIFKNCK